MRTVLWLAVILAALATVVHLIGDVGGGSTSGGASLYRTHGDGARAFADALSRVGHRVEAWRRPFARLDTESRGNLMFVLAPPRATGPDEAEVGALLQWVRSGNTVVWLVSEERRLSSGIGWLLRELGVDRRTTRRAYDEASPRIAVGEPTRFADGVAELATPGRQRLGFEAGGLRWVTDRGEVVVGSFRLDAGHVVLGAEVDLATNRGVGEADNFALWLNAIDLLRGPEGKVFFDEYHQGYRDGERVGGWLEAESWPYLGAHLGFLALLYLLSKRRLGPQRRVVNERRRRPAELIESLASLYARSRQRTHAWDQIHARITRRLQEGLGRSISAPAAEVAQLLVPGGGPRYDEAARALETLRRRNDVPDDADVIAAARAAARLERALADRHAQGERRG